MAKSLFTQCACLLTEGHVAYDQLKAAVASDFEIAKEVALGKDWRFGGPTMILPFRPEVNGYGAVDVVEQVWPDSMGDPKAEPMTFGAWSLGQFGPLTYPGGLARAGQHGWAWAPAAKIAEGHRGFVRVRTSYGFGAAPDALVMPKDYDPLAEMHFLDRVVVTLLEVPAVLCYFNPNGEVLRDRDSFHDVWEECLKQQYLPLPLWVNIRFFTLNEKLCFMDSVGNGQLDIPDIEAVFPKARYRPADVDYYLRNITHYLLDTDRELKTGEAIDGPGETGLSWMIERHENGIVAPPRRVLRLFPWSDRDEIHAAIAMLKPAE